jgi:multiple antibiotic resistance protein|uniref:UPF0056 membrane protein n=1 Tax=candidate division WOR-3 bacterium TaxID=2052148 RepID=A0A7C3Z267_UNCW3
MFKIKLMLRNCLLAFIPMFAAVNALGILPVFISLTENLSPKRRKGVIYQSFFTSLSVALIFLLLGKVIFHLFGITISDFMVAGGILLLVISLSEIIAPETKVKVSPETLGAVPLGMPLIVGPAVLTTSLIIVDAYGLFPTLISLITNIALSALAFHFSTFLVKIIGLTGTKIISKVSNLLLAAIAVMLIRKGIISIITNLFPP